MAWVLTALAATVAVAVELLEAMAIVLAVAASRRARDAVWGAAAGAGACCDGCCSARPGRCRSASPPCCSHALRSGTLAHTSGTPSGGILLPTGTIVVLLAAVALSARRTR